VAGGEWESLAGLVIIPALEQAAAELNERPGLVAEVSEHPFDDACILWIGRHDAASPFLSPHGSFAIHDEPVLPMIRVEEADPRISAGRPVVQVYLRQAEVSVASIKAMVLAFADRLPAVEQHNELEPMPAAVAVAPRDPGGATAIFSAHPMPEPIASGQK